MSESFDESNIPRYAIFRGRKVRVVGYDKARPWGPFQIVDTDDTQRSVTRAQLRFVKEAK